ncbi:MAG TPA: DUF2330 domain-containing protein [Actinomycetota bacterium]|nr:DUF2330 domain-containing protein [Actinomycetota bacterium]
MRRTSTIVMSLVMVACLVGPALACAGLVAPNGSVKLLRTATLAGYANGVEHYITSFSFQGGGAKFGSIVPLPDIPSKVTRGGDWTLQRLEREVTPPAPTAAESDSSAGGSGKEAEEIYETEIDGLKITILRGGARAVGTWAKNEGFKLSPDTPEVLHFYAQRSKIFMAARFVPERAEEEQLAEGDGIPIHLRIPTDDPWVPLRILGLGKRPYQDINANVFLLTEAQPTLLPAPKEAGTPRGMVLDRSEQASDSLMNDLRSDKGMGWLPEDMWLTYLRLSINARNLTYDLAIDETGQGTPSEEDAYGKAPEDQQQQSAAVPGGVFSWAWLALPLVGVGALRKKRIRIRVPR